MPHKTIIYRKEEQTVWLTLNRPLASNTMKLELANELFTHQHSDEGLPMRCFQGEDFHTAEKNSQLRNVRFGDIFGCFGVAFDLATINRSISLTNCGCSWKPRLQFALAAKRTIKGTPARQFT